MAATDVVSLLPSPPRPRNPCPLTMLRRLNSLLPRTLRLSCTTHLHRSVTPQNPRPLVLPPDRTRTLARSPSPCLAASAPRTLDPSTATPRKSSTSSPKISPPRPCIPSRIAPPPAASAPQLLAHSSSRTRALGRQKMPPFPSFALLPTYAIEAVGSTSNIIAWISSTSNHHLLR